MRRQKGSLRMTARNVLTLGIFLVALGACKADVKADVACKGKKKA